MEDPITSLIVNVVVGVLTLVAVGIALWQVHIARSEAADTARAMVRERRLTFELGLLAEIYRQWGVTGTQHLKGYLSALIAEDSPDDELALLRAATGTKSSDHGRGLLKMLPRNTAEFESQVTLELDIAIRKRVEETE